jgi:hypothetical protein
VFRASPVKDPSFSYGSLSASTEGCAMAGKADEVMIVEDELVSGLLSPDSCNSRAFKVVAFSNRAEALNYLAQSPPPASSFLIFGRP